MDPRRGLGWGLRHGLGSGLIMIISGMLEVLAGGSLPIKILGFFAILCANVSLSLQRQTKARSNKIR